MQGGVRVGGAAAAATSSSWEATRQPAWEALGDLSACATEARFVGKAAWELRFQAQLERVALNMEDADKFYKCSIVADPLYAQAWIEVADIRVHAGHGKAAAYWAQALVRELPHVINRCFQRCCRWLASTAHQPQRAAWLHR